jgi:hypothetical protein
MWQSTTLRDDLACIDDLYNSTGVPFCHEILQIKGPKREVNKILLDRKKLSRDLHVHIGTSIKS